MAYRILRFYFVIKVLFLAGLVPRERGTLFSTLHQVFLTFGGQLYCAKVAPIQIVTVFISTCNMGLNAAFLNHSQRLLLHRMFLASGGQLYSAKVAPIQIITVFVSVSNVILNAAILSQLKT